MAVLEGSLRGDEAMVDLVIMSPVFKRQARKLGFFIRKEAARSPSALAILVERPIDRGAGHGDGLLDPEAVLGVVVMHGEKPMRPTVGEPVVDEVQALAPVRLLRHRRPLSAS